MKIIKIVVLSLLYSTICSANEPVKGDLKAVINSDGSISYFFTYDEKKSSNKRVTRNR